MSIEEDIDYVSQLLEEVGDGNAVASFKRIVDMLDFVKEDRRELFRFINGFEQKFENYRRAGEERRNDPFVL